VCLLCLLDFGPMHSAKFLQRLVFGCQLGLQPLERLGSRQVDGAGLDGAGLDGRQPGDGVARGARGHLQRGAAVAAGDDLPGRGALDGAAALGTLDDADGWVGWWHR